MRAIIIAAGRGSRLGPITDNLPKPLVEVNGESILGRQITLFNKMGINDILVISGYKRDKINFENIKYVVNKDYKDTEQLFSLMKARSFFSGDLIVSFGDIIYDEKILIHLVNQNANFLLAVDSNWKQSYEKRPDNPAIFADFISHNNGVVNRFFTQLDENLGDYDEVVEFIGLMKLSPNASEIFLKQYLAMEKLDLRSVEKLKIISFLEELRKSKVDFSISKVKDKWCEIDTAQDLEIARKMFR